jgi:hypothetical protein
VRVSDNEFGYPEEEVEDFQIGMFASYGDVGDAWVRAPDGSHCSLVWETGSPVYFRDVIARDPSGRWVRLTGPATSCLPGGVALR